MHLLDQRGRAGRRRQQMIAALGSELAKYKLPKRIFIADSLPRNAMGKTQKNQLREEHKGTFARAAEPTKR